jgi:hypothetical protein
MPFPSLSLNRPSPFSVGRFLGSWMGVALTPLWPMLKWIFAPYCPVDQMLRQGLSVASVSQFQAEMSELGSGVLLGRILPELLLCLGGCVLLSWAFGLLGNILEERLRGIKV